MKQFTEAHVDDIIKLKFGKLVSTKAPRAYISDAVLAKIYKCSPAKIRQLYMARFAKTHLKDKSLIEQLQHAREQHDRQRWGYRFLKQHEIQWLTSATTLLRQTAMSLKDRCT